MGYLKAICEVIEQRLKFADATWIRRQTMDTTKNEVNREEDRDKASNLQFPGKSFAVHLGEKELVCHIPEKDGEIQLLSEKEELLNEEEEIGEECPEIDMNKTQDSLILV